MSDLIDILSANNILQMEKESCAEQNTEKWYRIKELYDNLEDWLSDLIEAKLILKNYIEITMHDKYSGVYNAKKLILKVGKEEIQFIPKARHYVGTTGKVAMKTRKGSTLLISDMDGIWKHVISQAPFKIEILTKNYFRNLLKNMLITQLLQGRKLS